ncbi:Hypothetical predicted protein [Olea europaea subsp. europaea]|uniref:Uncharacterized protein n=1 Tax=Olea europaea subsp. europaea TaxID=158383 RepID=A0A8S0U7Q9_OLEEU|nr:Hypothetical predicted protein [Olea europaea subsp. europaea]
MNFLYFTVGILAILGKTIECFSATKCNGSTIGDCIPVNEEFLMESEISRRILAQPDPSISYETFKPAKPFCKRDAYGSCIGDPNTNFNNRPCNYNNLCVGILAILGEMVKTIECFSDTKCDGSTIGNCIPANEEFQMESEISRRILAQPMISIIYEALKEEKPFCNKNTYGSCV